MPIKDFTGNRYGRLLVIKFVGTKNGKSIWLCQCDCGNTKTTVGHYLQTGRVKSCGCLGIESRKNPKKITHNESYTRLHDEWRAMKWRCRPKYHAHHRYYDRGIRVCEEWEKSYEVFREWALNNGYSDSLTLDRKDNDKGYCPDNCRWISNKEQQNNRSTNVFVEYLGKTQTLKQWSEELKLNYGMLKVRHRKGWKGSKLFSQPRTYTTEYLRAIEPDTDL